MKFESEDLIYLPKAIQKCNKIGGITDSTKRYGFWKKILTNQSGVFYEPLDNLHSSAARWQQDSCGILT